jgi:hypothetical protein
MQSYESRIYQMKFWGSRVYEKLGAKCVWQFDINGPQQVSGDFGGQIDATKPWRFKCWFGGWDGDLLIGYSRGSLSMPFKPD